jgi:hypothetical protein
MASWQFAGAVLQRMHPQVYRVLGRGCSQRQGGPQGGRWSLFPQVLTTWLESQTAARGRQLDWVDVRGGFVPDLIEVEVRVGP